MVGDLYAQDIEDKSIATFIKNKGQIKFVFFNKLCF